MKLEDIVTLLSDYEVSEGREPLDLYDLYEFLSESEEVYEEDLGNSRWWQNVFTVVKVGPHFIGYENAHTTGDDSPYDKGWEFDPKSVCLVKPREEAIIVTRYDRVPTESE